MDLAPSLRCIALQNSMAVCLPSTLASSVEKANGAKLSRLLIDGGTAVLRTIFDGYHPPANLSANLNANYSALKTLLKKKVLRAAQWDKLFPPGGATPDSNTFDITLLFLLLTNICKLSSPLSGWHAKPSPSDNSLEANLARVKFFRNELYGHVTSTSIDTPTFSSLWQKISAVLVALGLDQIEIDRLKAENSGEKDYLDLLLEWTENEEDMKSKLMEIQHSQTKSQQSIFEVREAQREDHMVLEDTMFKLEELHRTQINTQRALAKLPVHQMRDEDINGIHSTKSMVEEVLRTQKEYHKTLQQLKHAAERVEDQKNNSREGEILKKLARIDTCKDVVYHTKRYQEGTRITILEKVETWLVDESSQNRVMVITGNAGMGKSVIAAVLCKRMQEAGRLLGSHFCQHDKARHRNPKIMLQSLACQLSDCLPPYKNVLVETLSRNLGVELNDMEVQDLFQLLFEEPLIKLKMASPRKNILMVIDGVDESEYQGRSELLDVISNHFHKLPNWIRFLVTTRPEMNIADSLNLFNPLQLEPNDEDNVRDIRLLFERKLSHVIKKEHQEIVVDELVRKSEGLILHAHLLVDFLKENVFPLDPCLLDSSLPSGISTVYHTYFKRLENELCNELSIKEEEFLTFLSALVAAREPLLLGFVAELMFLGTVSLADSRRLSKAISSISALLPIQNGRIYFFHKSVRDWLTDKATYGKHDFSVEEKEGHRILSRLCAEDVDEVKRKGVDGQLNDRKKYALQHCVQHKILALEANTIAYHLEEIVRKYILDLELVYAKLCVSNTAASEDIIYVQKQGWLGTLDLKTQCSLDTLLFLLRRHIEDLTKLPYLILQNVLNKGGFDLSSEALNLLETKYPEIPHMRYLHEERHQEVVQVRFQCSSRVACFDVSPQLDYLVSECSNGTIQLWSLHTAKMLWQRPAKVMKDFRRSKWRRFPLSYYRSVVFHPTKELVLPGVLSLAYTLDGELKPLFPESDCRFTICSISGDRREMLSDCTGDAKCIVLWSLDDGSEITRTTRSENVLSFAWSRDGRLLAISTAGGSICLVDVVDDFRTLAETATSEVCGMIKFSPDYQYLFCLHVSESYFSQEYCFRVDKKENTKTSWVDLSAEKGFFDLARRCDTPSVCGFLLGDPFSCFSRQTPPPVEYVLDTHSVVRNDYSRSAVIEILNAKKERENCQLASRPLNTPSRSIAISLNGETVYVVNDADVPTITAFDVSSGKLKAKKSFGKRGIIYFAPVKEGIVVTASNDTPKLWNCQLSKCIRGWSSLDKIAEIFPVTDEHIACVRERVEVSIINTSSGNIVSTISTESRECVACNSKFQVISSDGRSVQLSDGTSVLWEKEHLEFFYGNFSPDERFVVLENWPFITNVLVLSADTGNTLCSIKFDAIPFECEFISDEEIVVTSTVGTGYGLQMFHVRTGDLLSVLQLESKPSCLGACPRKRLIAVGLDKSDPCFKLVQVKLPCDRDPMTNRR